MLVGPVVLAVPASLFGLDAGASSATRSISPARRRDPRPERSSSALKLWHGVDSRCSPLASRPSRWASCSYCGPTAAPAASAAPATGVDRARLRRCSRQRSPGTRWSTRVLQPRRSARLRAGVIAATVTVTARLRRCCSGTGRCSPPSRTSRCATDLLVVGLLSSLGRSWRLPPPSLVEPPIVAARRCRDRRGADLPDERRAGPRPHAVLGGDAVRGHRRRGCCSGCPRGAHLADRR